MWKTCVMQNLRLKSVRVFSVIRAYVYPIHMCLRDSFFHGEAINDGYDSKEKKKRKKKDVSFLNWQRKIGSRSREGKKKSWGKLTPYQVIRQHVSSTTVSHLFLVQPHAVSRSYPYGRIRFWQNSTSCIRLSGDRLKMKRKKRMK